MKFFSALLICFFVFSVKAQSIQQYIENTAQYSCYFEFNSAIWGKDSIQKFNEWLTPFLQKKGLKMHLIAYTDTVGTIARNQKLAQHRLNTVRSYMTQQNFGVNEISVLGESYDQKNYSNDKLFRKVEVILFYDASIEVEDDEMRIMEERMQVFANSNAPVDLNIQFVGGQDVYIGDSYLEVAALLNYLKQNPKKKAFIRGHVCCFNDIELSNRRALAVYNDLLLEGIAVERISYQGFGNTMPVAEELDEDSRQQNRRVDVVFSEL